MSSPFDPGWAKWTTSRKKKSHSLWMFYHWGNKLLGIGGTICINQLLSQRRCLSGPHQWGLPALFSGICKLAGWGWLSWCGPSASSKSRGDTGCVLLMELRGSKPQPYMFSIFSLDHVYLCPRGPRKPHGWTQSGRMGNRVTVLTTVRPSK
jgi:hypothetical protein